MFPSGRQLPLLLVGVAIATALAQTPDVGQNATPLTTREHIQREHWWPSMQLADHSQFAGTQACAGCHGAIVRTQSTAEMALTMRSADNSSILAAHTGKIFAFGSYTYSVEKTGSGFAMKVSDGTQERTEPLQWSFGSGAIAQSYVWWQDGQLYESRFNYFAIPRRFDQTPARLQDAPVSLDMAEGRKTAEFEARKCYACHSSALTSTQPLSTAQFYPGVTCEGCHGPGREHIATVRAAASDELHIVSPAHLTPVQAVDFCGACHGTPKDVALMGMAGKITVRFPAYRLVKSRCWGASGDPRLTCFACHNPHRPLERVATAYDAACLRCHANGAASQHADAKQKACPVAKTACTSCHMPKIDVANMHYKFSDHDIRIVKPNAPFPD